MLRISDEFISGFARGVRRSLANKEAGKMVYSLDIFNLDFNLQFWALIAEGYVVYTNGRLMV